MQAPHILNAYRSAIDGALRSMLAPYTLPLYDMMRYHLGWIDEKGNASGEPMGKALRPTLCLMACEAGGSGYERAIPAAVAVELIHNYSLIHDDLQDGDEQRRHRPTVWKIWGGPQAINAGSAMRVLANLALTRARGEGLPADKYEMIQGIYDRATLRLIEGQYLDIKYEDRFEIDIGDYLAMIGGKTAALISCSMEAGAIIGADDLKSAEKFRELGENLGIAFQIRDDILGIWGDSRATGKPGGGDIKRRKKTLPIVFALSNGSRGVKRSITGIFQKEAVGDLDVKEVMAALEEAGAFAQVQGMVEDYCERSRRLIYAIPMERRFKDNFEQIVEFLSARSH
jgi:geranylgeranyl diphosphate synthase type I